MQAEIRHIKSLPEIRRVIRSLSLSMAADRKGLATISRQMNLAALGGEIVLAARPKKSAVRQPARPAATKNTRSRPMDEEDWEPITKPSRSARTAPAPAPSRPVKTSRTRAPEPEPEPAASRRGRPRKADHELVRPREPSGRPRGRPRKNPEDNLPVAPPRRAGRERPEPEPELEDDEDRYDPTQDDDYVSDPDEDELDPEVDPEINSDEDEDEPEPAPRGSRVRGGDDDKPSARTSKVLDPKTRQQIQKLTEIVGNRHDKLKVADHINALLNNHYTGDDPTALRMQKLSEQLVKDHWNELDKAQRTLHSLGEDYGPTEFKETSANVQKQLGKWLKGRYDKFTQHLAVGQGEYKGQPATFYFSYMMFDNLRGPAGINDSIVVVTHVQFGAMDKNMEREGRRGEQEARETARRFAQNNKQAELEAKQDAARAVQEKRRSTRAELQGAERARPGKAGIQAENFVRVLAAYHPPSWFIKQVGRQSSGTSNALGRPFGNNIDEALRLVKHFMQSEGFVSAINRTVAPVKTEQLQRLTHDLLEKVDLVEDDTVLQLTLKPGVGSEEDAMKIFMEAFAQLKRIIMEVHPRHRNMLRMASKPTVIAGKNKAGKVVYRKYRIDIEFDKPDGGTVVDMPRDKLKDFMEAFEIEDPAMVRDMIVEMKNFLGIKHSSR